jgi:hypothetical protein
MTNKLYNESTTRVDAELPSTIYCHEAYKAYKMLASLKADTAIEVLEVSTHSHSFVMPTAPPPRPSAACSQTNRLLGILPVLHKRA